MQLGKIIGTAVCSEATTDFLFYLDFPNSPLTGIVIVWHTWIGEKGEQVVFDLKDTSLEFRYRIFVSKKFFILYIPISCL